MPLPKLGALSELMRHVEQQMGRAGVRRLERAADLVPNLEQKFTERGLKNAFAGETNQPLMIMKPSQFENYAQPIWQEAKSAKDFPVGNNPNASYQEYINYLEGLTKPGAGGFRDVPFLQIGHENKASIPEILGHEGRHRSAALAQAGDEPSLVRVMPRWSFDEDIPRHKGLDPYLEELKKRYSPETMVQPEISEIYGKRSPIQLPEMFAAGGEVVKKALQFAKEVPFVHYSKSANVSRLEPMMYGTGIKGKEAARLKDAPDIRPRSYFYVDQGGKTMRPEVGLGPHKYSGTAQDIYPLHEDPAGFSQIAKAKAIDPYMMSMGREVIDQPKHLNELERMIKEAGYRGYANDDVGLLFHPTEVQRVTD